MTNKIKQFNEKDFQFEKISFLKKSNNKTTAYFALTHGAKLLKYRVAENNLLTLEKAISIDVSTIIRNFTFDRLNNIVLPMGDNKLIIIDSTTFKYIETIHFDTEYVFDQITYLPEKNIFIGSSSNWELIILDDQFNIIQKQEAEDGTYYPLLNEKEDLISFLSYDLYTYYNLYGLNLDLSIDFIHSFFKSPDKPSMSFAFNGNEIIVSYPNELEYYEYRNTTLSKKWTLNIDSYPSEYGCSSLVFLTENIFLLGRGKKVITFDKLTGNQLEEVDLDLLDEIRNITFDKNFKCLLITTNAEMKLIAGSIFLLKTIR